jgi:hypothetical protein
MIMRLGSSQVLCLFLSVAVGHRQCVTLTGEEGEHTWVTSYLHYENVPVPDGSAPVGRVNFTAHTSMNNYTMTCNCSGADISWFGQSIGSNTSWHTCSDPTSPDIETKVQFRWDGNDGYLAINQEWLCNDGREADTDKP